MRTVVLGLVLAGFGCSTAQAADPIPAPTVATISKADLATDVDVLQRAYEQLHPGLYRYNTPEQMQQHFDALRAALDHGQPLSDAYLAFSQFAAKVKCGHTYANFTNQPKAIRQALLERDDRVPFYFRWLDGRMIVTRNFSTDPTLVPGTQVVSVDGIEAKLILARLMTIARADGSNDAKRVASLQVQGEDRYETFDVYFPLFYPQAAKTRTYVVRPPGGARERNTVLPSLTYAQRLAARPEATEDDFAPAWGLTFPRQDLAVLRMPTWALYDSKWDWNAFLKNSFDDLATRVVPNLVIDLRGNEGGLDVGHALLARLIDKDLQLPQFRRLVRYRKVPEDLAPMLDTWDPSFKDWGEQATPIDARFYRLTRYDDTAEGDVIRPVGPRYRGRVFVLVGATNSSATFEFAQQVRQSGLGMLVGQPTGGNQRGINGGAFFFLRLPRSGIELDLPLIGMFPSGERADGGIDPDIPVLPGIDHIAHGRDAEMAAVQARL